MHTLLDQFEKNWVNFDIILSKVSKLLQKYEFSAVCPHGLAANPQGQLLVSMYCPQQILSSRSDSLL